MNEILSSRIEELNLSLQNDDLNRVSRRMLDFSRDFKCSDEIKTQAYELRLFYNSEKELGSNKIDNKHLTTQYLSLFEKVLIEQPEAIKTEQKGVQLAYANLITKRYNSRLHKFCLEPIDIKLKTGEITGLVGENGNGKTTLLRMLGGTLAPDSGKINYYFDTYPTSEWTDIKPRVAFVPQRLSKWYGTAEENLSFEASIKGIPADKNKEQTDYIINRFGLTNFKELKWSQLSGGYKLRFEIAKALVWEPSLLILDEPLANLDMQAQELLLQDLRNMADSLRHPVSIILSSQQLHEVEAIADRVIFLKNGRAVHNGSLNEFKKGNNETTLEVSGNFDYYELQSLFSSWEAMKIEKTASAYTVSFSNEHKTNQFLSTLIEAGFELEYFRNITQSTKKLFNDKY